MHFTCWKTISLSIIGQSVPWSLLFFVTSAWSSSGVDDGPSPLGACLTCRSLLPPHFYFRLFELYLEKGEYNNMLERLSRWPVLYSAGQLVDRLLQELSSVEKQESRIPRFVNPLAQIPELPWVLRPLFCCGLHGLGGIAWLSIAHNSSPGLWTR